MSPAGLMEKGERQSACVYNVRIEDEATGNVVKTVESRQCQCADSSDAKGMS